MGIAEVAGWLLAVFYLGAVVASGRCWLGVIRGRIRYAALRDATGIADAATLRRCFGLVSRDGFYAVRFSEVVRWRRAAGVVLTNLPVHLMFAAALALMLQDPSSPAFLAVLAAASAHALSVACAAASILAGACRPLTD